MAVGDLSNLSTSKSWVMKGNIHQAILLPPSPSQYINVVSSSLSSLGCVVCRQIRHLPLPSSGMTCYQRSHGQLRKVTCSLCLIMKWVVRLIFPCPHVRSQRSLGSAPTCYSHHIILPKPWPPIHITTKSQREPPESCQKQTPAARRDAWRYYIMGDMNVNVKQITKSILAAAKKSIPFASGKAQVILDQDAGKPLPRLLKPSEAIAWSKVPVDLYLDYSNHLKQ